MSFEKITKWTDKKYLCPTCGACQPQWTYDENGKYIIMSRLEDGVLQCTPHDIRTILASFDKDELEQVGITRYPENMIITVLPIIPPSARPSLYTEDKVNDDHLTVQYIEIIKANMLIGQPGKDKSDKEKKDPILTLKWRINVLFNNSGGKGKYSTTGKVLQGYGQRLAGKTGLPRENLMGKRVDQSGRTVIGPEPTLRIDQIAVPEQMARILTRQEYVCDYNLERIRSLYNEGKISIITRGEKSIDCRFCREPPRIGDQIDRQLMDGDAVYANRQPTLHKNSMIKFAAVLSKDKTLCFNLSNTKSFNADFDGDEMNIHVPQKDNEVAELDELSSIENHLLSERNGAANIVLVQDNILSLYLMSKADWNVSKHELYDMTMFLVDETGKPTSLNRILKRIEEISRQLEPTSGRGIISLCFPADFFYEKDGAVFKAGCFVGGEYTKALSASLLKLIYHLYGSQIAIMVINNLQFISNKWLDIRGFSIGYEDCLLKDEAAADMVKDSMLMCFARAEAIEARISHPRIREVRIQEELNNARNIGMKIARDGFRPDNNFNHTIKSGSKGDYFNIAQISGVLGQQYLNGQRIESSLNNGTRTLPHYLFDSSDLKHKYEARGFVRHSFLRGLNPREAFAHAVTGRAGVVATAMGTSETGYMQRRIIKLMEDVHVANDGTVRDETGLIYQFYYGNGLDVTRCPAPEIISNLAARLSVN
jgi:DNA-directed RNA polymerase beta' subunit